MSHPQANKPRPRRPVPTLVDDDGPNSASTPARREHAMLTVLTGERAGQLFPLRARRVVMGRSPDADIQFDDEGLSWEHACIRRMGGCLMLQDLDSTNGSYVNGERVPQLRQLEDGDRIGLGGGRVVLRVTLQDALEAEISARLYEQIVRDPLTGAYNRQAFEERLESELSYSRRHGAPLTVIFMDIDHFKQVNDIHGHGAGDEVLRQVITTLRREIREEDLLARYGGEEFVVIARGIATAHGLAFAERMRRIVARTATLYESKVLHVTCSLGVACTDTVLAEREVLLAAADRALYDAKHAGRDQVRACVNDSDRPAGG